MLTSISPLGERARGNRFSVTAGAHIVGSALGGAAVGAVAGALGWALLAPVDGPTAWALALTLVAVAAFVAIAADRWWGVPTIHRQVDERWIGAYRGWVYGAGYGLQLGAGVVTIVPSAITYAAIGAAAATGSPVAGALVGTAFGAARGLGVLLGGQVHTTEQLARLHRRVVAAGPLAARLTTAGAVAVGAAAVVAGTLGMNLDGHGISAKLPGGWEGAIRRRLAVAGASADAVAAATVTGAPTSSELSLPTAHLATVALPAGSRRLRQRRRRPARSRRRLRRAARVRPGVRRDGDVPCGRPPPQPDGRLVQPPGPAAVPRRPDGLPALLHPPRARLLPLRGPRSRLGDRSGDPAGAHRPQRDHGGRAMTATATVTAPSWPARLVDRLASRHAGDPSRRGFLVRAAVLGTAIAANPLRLLLRPGTAYASVCGPGSACNDGWTVMCCTVNGGANTCPPGSFAAGWWKADGSAFCGGAARYIVDCNREPWNPGACGCRCHNDTSTCDNRRHCCNVFRYGQCHLEVGGVTPVVCRVILCTPPWEWDPACTPTSRTDNATVNHTAPCLPGPGASAITLRYQDLGLVGSALGRQTGPEVAAPGGGIYAPFENGIIAWHPHSGAHEVRGVIGQHHADLGGLGGFLGYPMTDEKGVGDGRGRFNRFMGGAVYWTSAGGAWEVHGDILGKYDALGGPRGPLRYPTSDELAAAGGGRESRFENGAIAWRVNRGAWSVQGLIHARWRQIGGMGGALGYPLSDEMGWPDGRGRLSWFDGGAIFWTGPTGAWEVRGAILHAWYNRGGPNHPVGYPAGAERAVPGGFEQPFAGAQPWSSGVFTYRNGGAAFGVWGVIGQHWRALGGQGGPLGYPLTDEQAFPDGRGHVSWFDGGAVFWTAATGAHEVSNPILHAWFQRGGPMGRLGYPVTGMEVVDANHRRVRFERGTLLANLTTGAVVEQ